MPKRKIFDEIMEGFDWLRLQRQGKAKGGRVTEVSARSAKGLRGILCRSVGGQYFLRVPAGKDKFIDVDLAHSDLDIEVVDPESAIYRRGDQYVLDHAPATLGYEVSPKRRPKK